MIETKADRRKDANVRRGKSTKAKSIRSERKACNIGTRESGASSQLSKSTYE